MTLMYLTACNSAGRDYTILLDVARITAIAPYAEPSPGTSWLSGLDSTHRPGNREYLRVFIGPEREYVVLASEWPRLKQMLTRLNGGGFNRLGNDTDELEQPRFLSSAPRPRHEERVELRPSEDCRRFDPTLTVVDNPFDEAVAEMAAETAGAYTRRCTEAIPAGYAVAANAGGTTCSSSR